MICVDVVSPTSGAVGGVETVLNCWAKYLDRQKFRLRFFAFGHAAVNYLPDAKEAYMIDASTEDRTLDSLIAIYDSLVEQVGPPDICIANISPSMTAACLAVRNRRGLSFPVVSYVHNDLSYFHESFGTIHDMLGADAHLCLHSGKAEELRALDPAARCFVIGNPIEPIGIPEDIQRDPHRLTFIGRLDLVKGIDYILEAIYRSKYREEWHLRIIGDGEIRPDVESWIHTLKLDNQVEMLGWKDHPFDYCTDSQILIMGSQSEGFPVTAYQGFSAGMTLLSTPVGSLSYDLIDGVNGYSYPYGDAEALSRILDDIHTGERSLCDPLDCLRTAETYFPERYFENLEDVLIQIRPEV